LIFSWPVPAQKFKVQRYKTGTTVIISECELKIYERNTQLSEIFSTQCPILIRALEAALPQGVNMKIEIYDPEMEKMRYVPDKELLNLKTELETIGKK
jgi:large subunit ribosomal protein L48